MFEEMIDVIKLYLPNRKTFQSLSGDYGFRFNKDELQNMVEPFRKMLRGAKVEVYDSEGYLTSSETLRKMLDTPVPQKMVYQQFMAIIMGDKRNFITYIKRLPQLHQNVYRMILRNNMCLLSDVRKMMGLSEKPKERRYYWGIEKIDLNFVDYINGGYDDSYNYIYYVSIPLELREWMFDALLPGERDLVVEEELPDNLQEGCFELSTITHMPVVEALLEQGVLTMVTNKFSAASVKKGVAQLGAEEFFSGLGLPKVMLSLRGAIMLQTMGCVYGERRMKTGKKKMPEERLRIMRTLVNNNVFDLYPILLGYCSGLRPTMYEHFYGDRILAVLCNAVQEWKLGEWIEVSSIIRRYFQSTGHAEDLNFISKYQVDRVTVWNKFGSEERRVRIGNFAKEIGIPFCKGLLFYMAAWGWLDIACREYDSDDVSPYDTLEYVRMTPLGAYVLGLTDKYERPALPKNETYFELDPDRLIIRSLPEDNPYESLLKDTCIPIGNRRYRMTAETFLAHCGDKEDVQGKIDFFQKYISGNLTQVWTDFFDSLLKRCNPLSRQSGDDYIIYSISADNKPLIHLMANDPVLRPLIIRAENFIILVPKDKKTKFEQRLKSLGYLL